MADPWAFLDPEPKKRDPWSFLDRPASTSPQQVKKTTPLSDAWQATASPNLQRRKLPDGRWEYRPTPQEGREPAVTPAESPLAGLMGPYGSPAPAVEALGGQAVARAKQGLAALGMDLPGMLVQGLANAPAQLHNALTQPLRQSGDPVLERAYPEMPLAGPLPSDPVVEQRERIREEYERRRHGTAELFRDAPVAGAIADAGADLTFDLTNAIPGGAAGKTLARRAASELGQRALELAAVRKIPLVEAERIVAAEMKAASRSLTEGAEYTAEELADLAARKRGLARLRPEDIEPTMPAAPPPRRLGAGIPDAEIEQRLGMRTTREEGTAQIRRLDQPSGAALPTPRPGGGVPPRGDLPGVEAPSGTPSTKGIENSAGLQPDLHAVVEANRGEIAAARGPVVPVSRWHDAEGLAERLKMTPDDFLALPPDRTLSSDELSLGRHYLGGMKQEAKALDARIAAGQVDDIAAAQAEKVARDRDIVRMMARLQGQGSSENARAMRSLQEALDPYGLAETPREKVQLSLLKKYKAANADEAARIEAAAVARLKRQAARETRKAGRQVTAGELDAELGNLVQEFRAAARRPRAFSTVVPLDPELVAVVGKMAANRVRAGVVAVEELADQVYTAVAQHLDGITREQVKAAIVEHASTRPAKMAPEEARLRRAEAAAGRAVKKLEDRIAAGGAPPAGKSSPWSAKLGELKARQAELREQLAGMQAGQRASKPASEQASKLRARETSLSRQVQQAEERLAAGPQVPQAKVAPVDSPRLQELRQRLDQVRAEIAADPRQGLAARYRELLDDHTVEMIAALPDPEQDPEALLNFLRQMEKPTFRDFRTTYWINSLLSGTKTAARNLAGNVVRLGELTAMRPAGTGVEKLNALARGRAPRLYFRETLPATMGLFRGLPDGVKRFAFVMKEGYDPARLVAELTEGTANKFDQRLPVNPFLLSQNRGVRALGVPLTLPTRILEATDALFKTLATASEMNAAATRTAIREGLDGDRLAGRVAELLADPTDEMVESARAFALKATYQDPSSWVGNMASSIRHGPPGADELAANLRAKGGLGNRAGAALVQAPQTIGRHLLPFIHISDRVAAGVTDYIPFSKPFKLAREIAADSPEAADLIAKQAVGGVLGMLGITWAAQGKLVGSAPKDENLRNDFYAEGKQPYSLLVGGRWVPIRDTLGPWAGPFVAAAMYTDHLRAGEDPSAAIPGMALGSARYMLDASYLATLQGVIEAVDGESAGAGKKLESAAARVVAGYVPFSGLVRNVATAADPRVVQKEGFADELKAGIPGLRQDLPARIGTLGEELRISTGAAGGFLPVVPTKNKVADPGLAEELERLRATVAERRREIGRGEQQVKEARRAKDLARVRELRAGLQGDNAGKLDAVMETIRTQEMRIRKLRASGKPEDVIRRTEVEIQRRMIARLQKALAGLRSE